MSETSLFLIGPLLGDDAAAFAPTLEAACDAGPVAAVLLRLAAADERSLVNRIKALAPIAQARGAAVLVELPEAGDPAAIAVRGGADGLHVTGETGWRDLRGRLKEGRSLGIGGLRSRDDAMEAGESGADYLMFGEPRPDGWTPPLDDMIDRASWWAEIFETPCAVYAPHLEDVSSLAGTGAEFVALGAAVWDAPIGPAGAVRAALADLRRPEPVA